MVQQHLLTVAGTTTIPDLNHSDFYSTPIPLPSLSEQAHILGQIETETSNLDQLLEATRKSTFRLQEYRQALITAAVTGQIDVEAA